MKKAISLGGVLRIRCNLDAKKIRRYVSGLEREKEHERQSDAVDQALPQAPQRSLDRGTGRAYKKGRVCHTLPRGARPPTFHNIGFGAPVEFAPLPGRGC